MKNLCPEIYYNYPEIHKAADDENIPKLVNLLVHGGNPNELNDINQTPLMLVDNFFAAKILIEFGAKVNAVDNYGRSALTYASDTCYVKLLIKKGADLNVVDLDHYSILDYTFQNYFDAPCKIYLMMQAGADNNSQYQSDMQEMYENVKKSNYSNEFKQLWIKQNQKYNKKLRRLLLALKDINNL